MVCTALLDEAVDNALDVVGLHVEQLWSRTDSEDVLPMMIDAHSMTCDLFRPDSVSSGFCVNHACGDDRFSPGVRDDVSLDWRIDLDSHGMEDWECQLISGDSAVACLPNSTLGCTYIGFAGVSGYGQPNLVVKDADFACGLGRDC